MSELTEALSTIESALRSGYSFATPTGGAPDRWPAASPAQGNEALSPAFSPATELGELQERVLGCQACPLGQGRKNAVFGQGVLNPVVLVVGEGPGAEEDNRGLPFVGASGNLLDKMLASIGLSREVNCYIANVVKCRPPNNREPEPDERAHCMPYLRRQIQLLAPRAILCAGRTAAQALLSTSDGINRLRGKTYDYEGIPLIATYHPSALLRDETLKRPAWEDLKCLRALLERTNADISPRGAASGSAPDVPRGDAAQGGPGGLRGGQSGSFSKSSPGGSPRGGA